MKFESLACETRSCIRLSLIEKLLCRSIVILVFLQIKPMIKKVLRSREGYVELHTHDISIYRYEWKLTVGEGYNYNAIKDFDR